MMADLQYNFLNDTFTVYENVETPKKSTILSTPISGNLDIGDWGYVGTSFPAYIYTWNGTSWEKSEDQTQPDEIELETYIQSMEVDDPATILY